jgi:hypothetical protein
MDTRTLITYTKVRQQTTAFNKMLPSKKRKTTTGALSPDVDNDDEEFVPPPIVLQEKKKSSKKRRSYTCSKCGKVGHNKIYCPHK